MNILNFLFFEQDTKMISVRAISFFFILFISIIGFTRPIRQRKKRAARSEFLEGIVWYLVNDYLYVIVFSIFIFFNISNSNLMRYIYDHFQMNLSVPLFVGVPLHFLLVDLVSYWTHRSYHRVPFLWKIHSVHHCTKSLDVFTTSRISWLESYLSDLVISVVLGFLFFSPEIAYYSNLLFNVLGFAAHSYAKMPLFERLSWILTTPQVHTLHHLKLPRSEIGNFAGCFTFWDRIFGTYKGNKLPENHEIGLDSDLREDSNFITKFFFPFNLVWLSKIFYPVLSRTKAKE